MDPAIPADFDEMWITVTVRMDSGAEYSTRCDRPRGIWGNPLTREERLAKVQQCAGRVLSDGAIEDMVQIVERLEAASSRDIGKLVGLLWTGPPPSSA